MNGYALDDIKDPKGEILVKKGELLKTFGVLQDNGTTACGTWIYAGYFALADDGTGRMMPATKRRGQKDPGGWACIPTGPFPGPPTGASSIIVARPIPTASPGRKTRSSSGGTRRKRNGWVMMCRISLPPRLQRTRRQGSFHHARRWKRGAFCAPNEGPFPKHYEPVETPVEKNPFSSRMHNPVIKIWKTEAGKNIGNNWGKSKEFPIVATTYRVVEQWQAGGMSRWLGWLTECQPEMFIEMSKELAKEKGIQNGDRVKIHSARGEIQAVASSPAVSSPFRWKGRPFIRSECRGILGGGASLAGESPTT